MYRIGLDLGSSYSKGVLVDDSLNVVECVASKTGCDFKAASKRIIEQLSGEREIRYPIYTCGYGREQVDAPFVPYSEIIALAKAASARYGRRMTILDIGGQDTKHIEVSERGLVDNFKLNRKCAAGTGSFLEEIAFRLGVDPEDFDSLAQKSNKKIKLNSFCTVFAISEIIGMIKKGVPLPDIVMGIYSSIIDRGSELAPIGKSIVLTGGVPAKHPKVVSLFKERYKDVESPEDAQFIAAYGCVLLSERK